MKNKIKVLTLLVFALLTLGATASISHAYDRFDLWDYGYQTVRTNGRGTLVFQNSPDGTFMNKYQYSDGDQIYVNLYWRENGYAIAYDNGVYGYVDASYIRWNIEEPSPVYSDYYDANNYRYDLEDYELRPVKTSGRGALVFQKEPNGAFMYDYQYTDGDYVYVHLTWRERGYAIAWNSDDNVYGYVDASYIDWDAGSPWDNRRFDLSKYSYRTVRTKGRGALVFQEVPDGEFLYDYQFNDGDPVYVNLDWRMKGYAIAYCDGVYGYVDASYISW